MAVLAAEAGARVGTHLGCVSSPSSLLRLLCTVEPPAPSASATIIGIDDWAYKRRRCYGMLVCDLETGTPLELLVLPSLSAKQATWLLMKQPSDLDEEEQQKLWTARQASVTAETV